MLNVLNHVERVGEEAIGKRIVYEESRNGQQAQVMRVLASVTLQGAQIVGVTKRGSQALEDSPVTPRPLGADLALEVFGEISDDAVVVEQRVVHVEQKNGFGANRAFGTVPFHRLMDEPLMSRGAVRLGPKAIAALEGVGIVSQARARRKLL